MKQPITWKNVDAPDFRTAGLLNLAASEQFNNAFDGADRIRQAFADRGERAQGNNTEAFKNLLMQRYQSPEALSAAQASGEVDELRQHFGNTDTSQTGFSGIQSLIGQQRNAVNNQQTYEDGRAAISDRNSLAYAQKLMAENNNEGALGFAEQQRRAGILSNQGFSGFASTLGEETDADQVKDSNLATAGLNRQVTRNNFNQTLQTQGRKEVDRQIGELMAMGTEESLAQAKALIPRSTLPGQQLESFQATTNTRLQNKLADELTNTMLSNKNTNIESLDMMQGIIQSNPRLQEFIDGTRPDSEATPQERALLGGLQSYQENLLIPEANNSETIDAYAEQFRANDPNMTIEQSRQLAIGTIDSATGVRDQLTPQQQDKFATDESLIADAEAKNDYSQGALNLYTQAEKFEKVATAFGQGDPADLDGYVKGFIGNASSEFMTAVNKGYLNAQEDNGDPIEVPLTMPVVEWMAKNAEPGWVFKATPQDIYDRLAKAGFFDDGQLTDYNKIRKAKANLNFQKAGAARPLTQRSDGLTNFDFDESKRDIQLDQATEQGAGLQETELLFNAEKSLRSALQSNPDASSEARLAGEARLQEIAKNLQPYRDETKRIRARIEALSNQVGFIGQDLMFGGGSAGSERARAEIEELKAILKERAK